MHDIVGRTLYLHIGIPKTASSWLQSMVFSRLSHLHYVDSPHTSLFRGAEDIEDGQYLMASVFKRSSHVWDGEGDAVFGEMFGDKRSWKEAGRDALISDERIGRQGSRSALLCAHLEGLREKAIQWGFNSIKVILLTRRQDEWLASHYAQMSDRNPRAGQENFERLLSDVISPQFSRYAFGSLLDFGSLYQNLASVMGSENIMVWPYEQVKEDALGFLRSLLPVLNTPAADAQATYEAASGSKANVRSAGQTWTLRPNGNRLSRLRSRFSSRKASPATINLTNDLSQRVLQAYAAQNHRFSEATGVDLRKYGYFGGLGQSDANLLL
ncbi:hypothetical protein [Marivita sp.]|uniref:hypothetical protein n=1 Tax=Marivita sp. TaxID=2003365 RepID=UPI0025BDD89C|nr:hypothetical protein [Marivita sp.]